MKKGITIIAVGLVCAGLMMPQAVQAKENPTGPVTQGNLLKMIISLMTLAEDLPANPSMNKMIQAAISQKVSPPNGWKPDLPVKRGDLAVIILKVLIARGYEVDFDPDDAKLALEWLKENTDVPLTTVGEALGLVGPPVNKVVNRFNADTDPLNKRRMFGQPDENDYGTDAEYTGGRPLTTEEIQEILAAVPQPSPGGGGGGGRKPGTPDAPDVLPAI